MNSEFEQALKQSDHLKIQMNLLREDFAEALAVVLAERHRTREVLTLDERHFRALRTRDRKRFKLLPLDR